MIMNHRPNLTGAVICLILFINSMVWASFPRQTQMGVVRSLAYQMSSDTNLLANAARSHCYAYDTSERSLIDNLDALHWRAEAFYRQVSRYDAEPWRTEGDYQALHQAYESAEDGLGLLKGRIDADVVFTRMRNGMQDLVILYENNLGPPSRCGVPYAILSKLGRNIHRETELLYCRAIRDSLPDSCRFERRGSRRALGSLENLKRAAEVFYADVVVSQGDAGRIRGDYRDLARAFRKAACSIDLFDSGVRHDFYCVGESIDKLSDLSPQ